MRKIFLGIVGLLTACFILIQFIPVERDHPLIRADLKVPPEVKAILKRSCYDCHSQETRWPWYSYVAPVSWMISDDVRKGRKHLNFTMWDQYSDKKKEIVKDHIYEEVNGGTMPLPIYLTMHPEARFTEEDIKILSKWLGKTLRSK